MAAQTPDFFRARLDAMIDLRHPLAALATRLPWAALAATLSPLLAKATREHDVPDRVDLLGRHDGALIVAGISPAGHPRLPIRLMWPNFAHHLTTFHGS
jgi:transposase, IS5 family